MNIPLWILAFLPALAGADTIFNDYEDFYSAHKNTVFNRPAVGHVLPLIIENDTDETVRYSWDGNVDGVDHQLEINIDTGALTFDQRSMNVSEALAFWGDSPHPSDLGRGTYIYMAKNYLCLQDAPNGSGSARYGLVYLLKMDKKNRFLVKLPPLFASCANVRITPKGDLAFYHVEYIQAEGDPTGVTFMEYTTNGKGFIATGNKRYARFVEPGNAFRFAFK